MSASDKQTSIDDLAPPEASVPDALARDASVDLVIEASSRLTEVRLLNARLEPVAIPANTGTVHVQVAPGLYEAGFRTPDGWDSVSILVTGDHAVETVHQPQLATSTRTVSPSLSELSAATPLLDADSVIFSITAGETDSFPSGHVQVGLIGQADDALNGTVSTSGATCTWRFPAQPGHWRLRIDELDMREPYELPLTVVAGYRMVAGAVTNKIDDLWRVDLMTLRLRMAGDESEEDAARVARLEEAAFRVLQSGQQLYGEPIEALLSELASGKQLNPMLGLLAGLLAINLGKASQETRQRALDRLETLLNHNIIPHPDLAVLRLHLRIEKQLEIDALEPLPFPPLFTPSWRLLLEIARTYPALIPVNSLTDRVADRLWPSGLWVIWTSPPLTVPIAMEIPTGPQSVAMTLDDAAPQFSAVPVSEASVSLSPAEAAQLPLPQDGFSAQTQSVVDNLSNEAVLQQVRAMIEGNEGDGKGVEWEMDQGLTPSEAAIASVIHTISNPTNDPSAAHPKDNADDWWDLLSPTSLGQSLGLPDSTIMRSMQSLAGKLADLGKIEP